MRLSNPSSSDLGTYTWSQLQAAFPNGGAALAALPYSATAVVTDIGKAACKVTPNLAKTRWIPVGGRHRLMQYAGTKAAPAGTWSSTGKWTPSGGDVSTPADLFAADDMLTTELLVRHRGTAGTTAFRLRIGTTGTYATDCLLLDDSTSIADARENRLKISCTITAASIMTTSYSGTGQVTGASWDRTTNWNIAALMYLIIECSGITAGDYLDIIYWQTTWEAAP